MKTLKVAISENEFRKFGFTDSTLGFDDLLEIISKKTVDTKPEEWNESMTLDEFLVNAKQILRKKFDDRSKNSQ